MRITAAVAAFGLACHGCATTAMATLASFDPHGHEDTPLVFAGTLADGIGMTALGAGALDGHSSVGWSRGEGEWAMAGGITLLVLDAAVIALALAADDDRPEPPAGAPVTVTAFSLPGDDLIIVYYVAPPREPHIGQRWHDATYGTPGWRANVASGETSAMPFGEYRVCAIYPPLGISMPKYDPDAPIDQVVCTSVTVERGRPPQTIYLPPPMPLMSPR